jgi:hypothetical protein
VDNYYYGTTTFACPKGATGTPVVIKDVEELKANPLPPAKEVVHCTKVNKGAAVEDSNR